MKAITIFTRIIVAISIVIIRKTQQNDWRRRDNNPQLRQTYPIRIRINPKIWIQIQDHFYFKLDILAEVCALWAQSRLAVQSSQCNNAPNISTWYIRY